MKSNSIRIFTSTIATLLVSSFVLPNPAYAAPRDVGNISVDCDTGYLEDYKDAIYYFAVGDTFTIENEHAVDSKCLILDPNNILDGEAADHSGDGAGLLDFGDRSEPITIDGPGTFTITENGGLGDVVTFQLVQAFFFTNSGEVGEDAEVGDSFLYRDVTELDDGTTVDATVEITQLVNQDPSETFTLDRSDGATIRTSIDALGGTDGYVEYTVSFHEDNDPETPIILTDFSVTVKDIDSRQYLAAQDVDSFTLSETPATKLTSRTVGNTLFIEELNNVESETSDQDHWVVLTFDSASMVTLRLGSRDGGASFSTLFADGSSARAEFSDPATVGAEDTSGAPAPVSAPAATATPTLAATGPNVEWLLAAGLLAVIAGSSFIAVSRRKRV
jgi:hypothetical protein